MFLIGCHLQLLPCDIFVSDNQLFGFGAIVFGGNDHGEFRLYLHFIECTQMRFISQDIVLALADMGKCLGG